MRALAAMIVIMIVVSSGLAATGGQNTDLIALRKYKRILVTKAEYPFSAIGQLNQYWDKENFGSCTAAMVSACHVLTAKHCDFGFSLTSSLAVAYLGVARKS